MLPIQLLVLVFAFLCSQTVYGQKSLTLVLNEDATYQQRFDARILVKEVLTQKKDQISEFNVVTFGNETVELRNQTNHWDNELINTIGIQWSQNVDHKMALPAIKQALVSSRSQSYVFVFALRLPLNDEHNVLEEIKTLSLTKQIQIFVIWEYEESDSNQEATYKMYHQIAAASGGGLLSDYLYNTGIRAEKIATYVSQLIQEKRRRIDSMVIDGPTRPWKAIEVYISDQDEYTLVTGTGSYVSLDVLDKNNTLLSDYKSHVVFEPSFQAVKLSLPAGLYTLNVSAFGDVHVMVLGWSEFTFELGFSTALGAFNATEELPTTGVETHLMVLVTNPERKQVESVQLLDLENRILRILPLVRTSEAGEVYATWKFLPPEQTFKIAVITEGKPNSGKYHPAKSPVTPKLG